jgi:sarcosine oxidase subunit beta
VEAATVLVIGGGVLGLAAAEALSRRGVDVLLVEKSTIASGVTGRSVGVIETQYTGEDDIALRARAVEGFARLIADHGLEFTRTGYLRLGRSSEDLAAFERSSEIQASLGIAGVHVLDSAEIAGRIPDLDLTGVLGGLWGTNDGYVDPHHLCAVLADAMRNCGGRIGQQA